MGSTSSRWNTITESQFPWEQEALQFIRERLPDCEPYRAWANFEFIGDDGSVNEVDLLVLTPKGFFFIEIKSWPGEISGDAGTWSWRNPEGRVKVVDNPLLLANRKVKKLKSLLQRQKAVRNERLPFLKALIFLSAPDVKIKLPEHALHGVCRRDADAHPAAKQGRIPGIVHALKFVSPEEYQRRGYTPINAPQAKAISRAMEQAGIRRSARALRVGDYVLEKLLYEGPGYQDFEAAHTSLKKTKRRIRVFGVGRSGVTEGKATISRAAQREFASLEGVEHPGILKAVGYTEAELGPALIFEHDPDAVRLDHYLEGKGANLGVDRRLEILRQLAEAVAYAHENKLVHRALSPQSVLVRDADSDSPRLQIFNWQAATRERASKQGSGSHSRGFTGTSHPDELIEERAMVYMAPEAHAGPHACNEGADVFSLGAIAYRLFTGQAPAANALELYAKLRGGNGENEPRGLQLTETADGVVPSLVDLVQWATDPRLTVRLDSVKDFLDCLEAAEDELTSPAPEDEVNPLEARKGDLLPGGFTVLKNLGTGSTARVFLVERDGQQHVLKLALSPEQNDRLRDESEVLQKLRHPRIVALHEVTDIGDRVGLLLESGGPLTLRDRLRRDGRLSRDLLERFGDDLLDAVDFLEQEGIPHRDLKPENLGVAPREQKSLRLVLFDFSLSRAPLEQIRVGTPGYLDPFLPLRPAKRWDVHAERFAAAVVLYEMATGTLPIWGDGQSDPALIDNEVTIESDLFSAPLRAGLTTFFRKALSRDFRERFDNALELRRAWKEAFQEASAEGEPLTGVDAATLQAALDGATRDTPLTALPLGSRVQEAFERVNVVTISEALAVRASRLASMRGVGHKTRREVLEVIHLLGEAFPEAEPPPGPPTPAPDTDTQAEGPDSLPLDQLAARLLPRGKKKSDVRAREALQFHLGLDDLPEPPTGPWPGQAEVAKAVGVTRGRISQILNAARKRWAKLKSLTALRETFVELLEGQGGIATLTELERALLALRGEEAPEATRIPSARAVARAVLETERLRKDQRWAVRRSGLVLLVAHDGDVEAQAALDYAERLGRVADRIANADPLPSPARVEAELRAVNGPDGLNALSPERLVRLSAAASRTAASSSRLELYPRNLPAERALNLARGALLGAKSLTEEDVRQRIAARYPEAEPLPPRPSLDHLLEQAGLDLGWSSDHGKYQLRTQLTVGLSSRSSLQPRLGTALDAPVQLTPEVADARQLEERLHRAAEEGAFLVLAVEPRQLSRAREELLRFQVSELSLEAALLRHLRTVAEEKKVSWKTVLAADAAGPDGKRWPKLLKLVGWALDGLQAELLATDGVVLLTEPGLLARYDRLDTLESLRDALSARTGTGETRLHGLWLLLPQDAQHPLPVLDGKAVPVITGAQWTRLPASWLLNVHRAGSTAASPAQESRP